MLDFSIFYYLLRKAFKCPCFYF